MSSIHKAVLLNEIIVGLDLKGRSPVVLDGTFGGGGHSRALCNKHKGVKIIALDQDQDAINRAQGHVKNSGCDITLVNANFRNLDEVLDKEGISEVASVILDLGFSSDQLESSGRGFSFMKDEPLLMTMKENPQPEDLTAREIVNNWAEENLATIIYGYGEERFSKRIARGIIKAREKRKIESTFDLVEIIERSVPKAYSKRRIHPATKTFQALRIAVNDELGALKEAIRKGFKALKIGGRMAVISFHSLEDREVKHFYKDKVRAEEARLINKKPIKATKEEISENPRARSAKLRILEKIK